MNGFRRRGSTPGRLVSFSNLQYFGWNYLIIKDGYSPLLLEGGSDVDDCFDSDDDAYFAASVFAAYCPSLRSVAMFSREPSPYAFLFGISSGLVGRWLSIVLKRARCSGGGCGTHGTGTNLMNGGNWNSVVIFDRKELLGLKCMYCFFIHESVRLLEVQLVRNIAGHQVLLSRDADAIRFRALIDT